MYTTNTDGPDLLVNGGAIVSAIPGGWSPYPYGYSKAKRLCGDYYHFRESDLIYWEHSLIAWVEDGTLQRWELDAGDYPWICLQYRYPIPRSDSTFSCIEISMAGSEFKNLEISGQSISPATFFPDFGSFYTTPRGLVQMDGDYIVALANPVGASISLVLADLPRQELRDFTFNLTGGTEYFWSYPSYYNSDRWLYVCGNRYAADSGHRRVQIFRLEQMSGTPDDVAAPTSLRASVYPNPFQGSCTIEIRLNNESSAKVTLYNTKGQMIRELHSSPWAKGENTLVWDGRDGEQRQVPAGIYYLKVQSGRDEVVSRIVLLK
jgi:hypothetical protein